MLGIYEPTALDVPILSGSHGSLAVHLRKITRTVFNRYPTTKDVVLHDHGPGAHLNYLSDILNKVSRPGLHFVTWFEAIRQSIQWRPHRLDDTARGARYVPIAST